MIGLFVFVSFVIVLFIRIIVKRKHRVRVDLVDARVYFMRNREKYEEFPL